MTAFKIRLGNEENAPVAELSYVREAVQIPPMTLGAPLINLEIDQPAHMQEVILGSLTVRDHTGTEIATLRFTDEGLRLSMNKNGREYNTSVTRPSSGNELLFISNDEMFLQQYAAGFGFIIAQFHHQPENLEQQLGLHCQSAAKYGQAISIPPKRSPDDFRRGEGEEWKRG